MAIVHNITGTSYGDGLMVMNIVAPASEKMRKLQSSGVLFISGDAPLEPSPPTTTKPQRTWPLRPAGSTNLPTSELEAFNRALDKNPKLSDQERDTYADIFAWEGGMRKNPKSSAASGILQVTLDRARADLPELADVKTPNDLDVDQRVAIYKHYFTDVLPNKDGIDVLNDIKNKKAAGALADTIFRHGRGEGADYIQKAVRQVQSQQGATDLIENDKKMGPETARAYIRLANDPKTAKALTKALYDLRATDHTVEEKRFRHYRDNEP